MCWAQTDSEVRGGLGALTTASISSFVLWRPFLSISCPQNLIFIGFAQDDHVIIPGYYIIPGPEEMPKSNRLYWKRPMCVLIEKNFLDSFVTSTW